MVQVTFLQPRAMGRITAKAGIPSQGSKDRSAALSSLSKVLSLALTLHLHGLVEFKRLPGGKSGPIKHWSAFRIDGNSAFWSGLTAAGLLDDRLLGIPGAYAQCTST